MNHSYPPAANTRESGAVYGLVQGISGLTAPLTDLISGVIAALREGRTRAQDRLNRRHALEALNRLDERMLADIGLEAGDLVEIASRNLPLGELAQRRSARTRRRPGRLDIAVKSRCPAVNDETYRLVA